MFPIILPFLFYQNIAYVVWFAKGWSREPSVQA